MRDRIRHDLTRLRAMLASADAPLRLGVDYTCADFGAWADALGIAHGDDDAVQRLVESLSRADSDAALDLATDVIGGEHPGAIIILHELHVGPDAGTTAYVKLDKVEVEAAHAVAAFAVLDAACVAVMDWSPRVWTELLERTSVA